MNRRLDCQIIALLCLSAMIMSCAKGPDADTNNYETTVLQISASAGSTAPNLATGPGGTIVLSWIEPDGEGHALRYSVFDAGSWGDIQTVVTGDNWFVNWADFPSVVPVSDSEWAAHWLVRREAGGYAYDIHAALSDDGGKSWSVPFLPHTDGTDTEHGFVTIFPVKDGVGMVWLDGRKFVNEYDEDDIAASGMTLRSAVFGIDGAAKQEVLVDDLICDCCQTDVAITSRGPVAVYRDRTVAEIRDIYLSRSVEGDWQTGKPVGVDNFEIPGCPVNGPVIQANGNNLAVAWFSGDNEQPKVQVAWSGDAGQTMTRPVRVADGDLYGHVGGALLANGDMAVSWLSSADDGTAALHLRRVSSNGDSGPDTVIAKATGVAAFSVPQVVLVDEKLLLAWTDTSGEKSRVKSALVPLRSLDKE